MPSNPVAITTDQALTITQAAALGQCLLKVIHRQDLAQPRRQVNAPFNLVEQTAGHSRTIGTGIKQAQIALTERRQIKAAEIIHQHCLQVGAEYGFHRQLPTWLDPQALSQPRTLLQALLAQPLRGTGARFQRSLLQGFKRRQPPSEALHLTLGLLLCLDSLLQLFAQRFQLLDHLVLLQLQVFEHQLAAGHLLTQFENRRVFRVGAKLVALLGQFALALGQTLKGLFELLDAGLLHLCLSTRLGGTSVERVPLLLPAVHGAFGFFQGRRRLFSGGQGHFLLGLKLLELFAQSGEQGAVMPQVRFGFQT
ncbi:hypothetical protein D3C81_727720 [compost metagenome]